jgi:DNA-binding IclR family transcriptional regulator
MQAAGIGRIIVESGVTPHSSEEDRSVAGPRGDIQVVGRCAQILRLYSTTQRSLRIADVASDLGLGRTTAHRYLTSMANADLLERDEHGSYGLGPLLVQLGTVAMHGPRVLEVAAPYLQRLADEADETVVLAVWGGIGPVVARVHEATDRLVNISVRVGSPLPLEAAQSQVFLAFLGEPATEARLLSQLPQARRREIQRRLEAIREDGYTHNAEVVQGIRAIAAPVLDGHSRICATAAIIGTVNGIPDTPPSGLLLALLRTAAALSRELGYRADMPFESLIASNQTPILVSDKGAAER